MKRRQLNGKNLMLWIGTKVIALSKTCRLTMSGTVGDGNTKDDGIWSSGELVGISWSVNNQSVDSADQDVGNDLVYDELYDKMVAGEPVDVSYGIPSNASNDDVPEGGWQRPLTGYYHGKALITNLDRGGDKGSSASVTVDLQGVGPLKRMDSGSGQ